jgi:FSR family fosmidomycin resistance protein-like MFS transporter
LGTGLVLSAAVLAALGLEGWGVLAMACVGNAFFHLTAGKHVLETHGGRSGPLGLFIATGALGLMAGQVGAARASAVCLPIFAAGLAILVVLAAARKWNGSDARGDFLEKAGDGLRLAPIVMILGLWGIVAWRSWAALTAGGRSAGGVALLMLIGAAVTFAGKVTGGYLAEWLGRWKVTAVSVAGSALLAFFCDPSWLLAWFVLLFVAQLATGPVLSLLYDATARRGGMAFGLNCFGLFTGSLA